MWKPALMIVVSLGLSHWWQKQKVIELRSQIGLVWQGLYALAIIGVASIVTLTYVIRSFVKIWFEPNPKVKEKAGDRLLAPALLVLLSLLLGVWAEPLVSLSQWAAAWLGDPAFYITAILP